MSKRNASSSSPQAEHVPEDRTAKINFRLQNRETKEYSDQEFGADLLYVLNTVGYFVFKCLSPKEFDEEQKKYWNKMIKFARDMVKTSDESRPIFQSFKLNEQSGLFENNDELDNCERLILVLRRDGPVPSLVIEHITKAREAMHAIQTYVKTLVPQFRYGAATSDHLWDRLFENPAMAWILSAKGCEVQYHHMDFSQKWNEYLAVFRSYGVTPISQLVFPEGGEVIVYPHTTQTTIKILKNENIYDLNMPKRSWGTFFIGGHPVTFPEPHGGHQVIKLEANESIIFRQDLLHQGGGYEQENLRFFAYYDLMFVPRPADGTEPIMIPWLYKTRPDQVTYPGKSDNVRQPESKKPKKPKNE